MREKGGLHRQNLSEEMPGLQLRVRKPQECGGSRKRTKAGMPLKGKDMPICDRPIKVFGEGGVGDFALRDAVKQTQEA